MLFREMAWISTYNNKLDRSLQRELSAHYHTIHKAPGLLRSVVGPVLNKRLYPVIIQARPGLTEQELAEIQTLVAARGEDVNLELPIVNGISTRASIATIQRAVAHEQIERIYLDREVKALLDVAGPAVNAPIAWQSNLTGKGVTVAVIDTGIYPHPDLTKPVNRLIGFKDYVGKKTTPYDDNGHGTHCAGNVGGNGYKSGAKYRGIAPDVKLVGVKVLNQLGSGLISRVVVGIQWCIDNRSRYGIGVISLSLGAPAVEPFTTDILCQAVKKAWDAGIVCCVAAGNEGPKQKTISTPGIAPSVLTVGATDDRNSPDRSDDVVADFSSRGPTIDGTLKPDIVSPGTNIISLRAPKSFIDRQLPKSRVGEWYFTMSGTSMATPVCAGAVALLLQKEPSLTPDQVKALMVSRADKIGNDPYAEGLGYINIDRLINTEEPGIIVN